MRVRKSYNLFLFVLVVLLAGCGTSRRVIDIHTNAEEAYRMQKYEEALFHYEELIELETGSGREIEGETWYRAGMAARETGQTRKTIEYLGHAHRNDYASERSYQLLAAAYRETDNLSLEISNLEAYNDKYPEGENIEEVRERLFKVYIESRNFDEARQIWTMIENRAADDPELFEQYFILNRELDNEGELEEIANKLLALDRDSKTALVYLAEKYFWEAENQYQKEMKAYEQEQTRRQYRELLNALDEVNRRFRTSRDYFERLYKNDPSRRNAEYLMNIYIRFGNEERAEFYRKRAN